MEVKFKSYNILTDDNLKEWLKFYSNWPSFPQVYINQKFVGGTEVILELVDTDHFLELVPTECIKANALERIKTAMNQGTVVIFMKGTPKAPVDGYQARAIEYLDSMKVKYGWFDVTVDSDVREIVKEQSRWNSFPQLFIRGKFVGGLFFIEDMITSGKISNYIPMTELNLPHRDKIYNLMAKGTYMIFMRGKPLYPTCQASR